MYENRLVDCAIEVVENYRKAAASMPNVEIDILPGVLHGYMMPWSKTAFDAPARKHSMEKTLAILSELRGTPAPMRRAS